MSLKKQITIINRLGLHARATAKLTDLARNFDADIHIQKDDTVVDAKSIMGVMMLAASCGSVLTIVASGQDEAGAMSALCALIDNKFDEAE